MGKSYLEMSIEEKDEWAEKQLERAYAKDCVRDPDWDIEEPRIQKVPVHFYTGSSILEVIDADCRHLKRKFKNPAVQPKIAEIGNRGCPKTVPAAPLVINAYPSGAKKVAVISTESVGGYKVVYPYGEDFVSKSTQEAMPQAAALTAPPAPIGTNDQVPCASSSSSSKTDPSAAEPPPGASSSSSDYN